MVAVPSLERIQLRSTDQLPTFAARWPSQLSRVASASAHLCNFHMPLVLQSPSRSSSRLMVLNKATSVLMTSQTSSRLHLIAAQVLL